MGVVNQADRTPEIVFFIHEKIMSVPSRDHARCLPDLAFCAHTLMNVLRKDAHVLHDQLRIFEDVGVDALEDKVIRGVACDNVRVVDVAIPKFPDFEDIPLRYELLSDECKIFQGITPVDVMIMLQMVGLF